MSKMSQAHAELTEQAAELGFESIQDAEKAGYHITYTKNDVCLAMDMDKALNEAHEDWLKEKDSIIAELTAFKCNVEDLSKLDPEPIERAINFLKKGGV